MVLAIAVIAYVLAGVAGVILCVWANWRRSVDSALPDLVFLSFGDPFFVLTLIPFAAFALWPVVCLADWLAIPRRRREKLRVLCAERAEKWATLARLREEKAALRAVVGRQGTAATALSLSGKVRIEGELWHALSVDGFLPAGTPVVVDSFVGNELRVAEDRKG